MRNPQPAPVPPSCSTSEHSAWAVPPVASRSSCTSTRVPGAMASVCSSSRSVPYSSWYSAVTVAYGSLPGLRARTKPASSSLATAGPSRKPRASAPMTSSAPTARPYSASASTAARKASGEAISGVMSRKRMPGRGKSGMSRTKAARSAGNLSEIPDEQQVLEVRGHRGEVLERLDGLLAPLGIPRAQRRGKDLLQQRRLAVGRRAEDAQVAPAHAVARQLGDGADDLALGLVEVGDARAHLALDDAVVLELLDQRGVGAGLVDDVVERVQRAAAAHRDAGRAPGRAAVGLGHLAVPLLGAPARELLADDAQRQELVALQAQDRAQPLDV